MFINIRLNYKDGNGGGADTTVTITYGIVNSATIVNGAGFEVSFDNGATRTAVTGYNSSTRELTFTSTTVPTTGKLILYKPLPEHNSTWMGTASSPTAGQFTGDDAISRKFAGINVEKLYLYATQNDGPWRRITGIDNTTFYHSGATLSSGEVEYYSHREMEEGITDALAVHSHPPGYYTVRTSGCCCCAEDITAPLNVQINYGGPFTFPGGERYDKFWDLSSGLLYGSDTKSILLLDIKDACLNGGSGWKTIYHRMICTEMRNRMSGIHFMEGIIAHNGTMGNRLFPSRAFMSTWEKEYSYMGLPRISRSTLQASPGRR